MAFHVGQKVVCIDDRPSGTSQPCCLKRGTIYTVRALGSCPVTGRPSICLEEIIHPIHPTWRVEWAYLQERFRPVVDQRTDISIFRRMLNPTGPTKEPAQRHPSSEGLRQR